MRAAPERAPAGPRMNEDIRVPEVRLIDQNGQNIGVVATSVAIARAVEAGLDLVEIAPESKPPVAKILDYGLAMTDKRRPNPNEAEIMNVIGDVDGKSVILVDDLVDTAGTAIQAGKALMREGAKSVTLCTTHGVLSGGAVIKDGDPEAIARDEHVQRIYFGRGEA